MLLLPLPSLFCACSSDKTDAVSIVSPVACVYLHKFITLPRTNCCIEIYQHKHLVWLLLLGVAWIWVVCRAVRHWMKQSRNVGKNRNEQPGFFLLSRWFDLIHWRQHCNSVCFHFGNEWIRFSLYFSDRILFVPFRYINLLRIECGKYVDGFVSSSLICSYLTR